MSLRNVIYISLIAAFSLCTYLVASRLAYGLGFPLDDAWIHQTYARNLAEDGEWAFLPGKPSAGSTAPAWSLALAAGHWLRLNPLGWSFLLGWGLLTGIGVVGAYSMGWMIPNGQVWGLWAGCLLVLEWHLVWAAGSGMETLAFTFIILLGLVWLVRSERQDKDIIEASSRLWLWFGLGALVGLSAWFRPDGVSLLAVVGTAILLGRRRNSSKLRIVTMIISGFMAFFLPYLWFNNNLAGSWWPNTFFAKQAEYASLREEAFLLRYLSIARLPLAGVGIILLPGFVWLVLQAGIQRRPALLVGAFWVIGYIGLYAWRLPVIYQHGRYVIPAIAVYCIWGFAGLMDIWRVARFSHWSKLLTNAWVVSLATVLLLFWGMGARAYAQDVAIIETEMVATARWVNRNLPMEALIAAHDIGALGYFGGRQIVDLAGLVSPEIIPFIRDELVIKKYLDDQNADFLITFPNWYPYLTNWASLIYSTSGTIAPQLGGENMTVYRWKGGKP